MKNSPTHAKKKKWLPLQAIFSGNLQELDDKCNTMMEKHNKSSLMAYRFIDVFLVEKKQ